MFSKVVCCRGVKKEFVCGKGLIHLLYKPNLHRNILFKWYVYLVLQFRNFKIVYRRYAGLYFCICVDVNDNNLAYLEAIHNFVEVLNEYFHNVCELDLVFNFYKVRIEPKNNSSHCVMYFLWQFRILKSFPHRRFLTHLQQTTWKNCNKRRNCSKQAIFPFATMFSIFFSNYTYNHRDF